MKAQRLLLAISVVGAVVVGGAVTGTTLASWRDQAALPASAVSAGSMSFAVAGPASGPLPVLGDMQPGQPRVFETQIRNSSPKAARNLRLEVRPTGFTSTNPAMPLTVAVQRPEPGQQCAAISAFRAFTNAEWSLPTPALAGPLAPGESDRVCVQVTITGATTGSDKSSNVTLDFLATQVRP